MPRPERPAVVALIALLACGTAQAIELPAIRDFGDWTVTCDNAGDCDARGFRDDGAPVALRFLRRAGAAAVPVLTLDTTPDGGRLPLRIDGRPWAAPAGRVTMRDGRDAVDAPARTFAVSGVDALQALVAQARSGKAIAASNSTVAGSLVGFNAAMLFIDDVQGRVDTPSALARPGCSARPVAAARALPLVRAVATQARPLSKTEARRYAAAMDIAPFQCDDVRLDEADVQPLGRHDVLVLIPCHRGAYQTDYAPFRGPRDDPRRARQLGLPDMQGVSGPEDTAMEASFDPATGILRTFVKGRGLADCGSATEWAFDGEDFVLTRDAILMRCGWPQAGDFPVHYRANVRPAASR